MEQISTWCMNGGMSQEKIWISFFSILEKVMHILGTDACEREYVWLGEIQIEHI